METWVTFKRHKYEAGLTLVEVLISGVILMIAILGTVAFRYNAALGARKADLYVAAARTALLLSEGWRAADEPNTFDPTLLAGTPELVITVAAEGAPAPPGFTSLGNYAIVADEVRYLATLSWKYAAPGSSLRTLNVVVAWEQRGSGLNGFDKMDKTFKLTTYAEN